MKTVGIIDHGLGNLHSIAQAMRYIATDEHINISADPDALARKDRLVLSGTGTINHCLSALQRLELKSMLIDLLGHKPLLGIGLGCQALMTHSEECGGMAALDAFSGTVRHLKTPPREDSDAPHKIPHLGWNQVRQTRGHPLWKDIASNAWFYFVHGYYIHPENAEDTVGTTRHGFEFTSALLRDNILAIQFHPEKSQSAGLQLLANFLDWDGKA